MSEPRRLRIDWIACNGYGVCQAAAPDLIELDDWGYPIIADEPVPSDLVGQANRAINDCPMLALVWASRRAESEGRLGRLRRLVRRS
jgi:ferredoxin